MSSPTGQDAAHPSGATAPSTGSNQDNLKRTITTPQALGIAFNQVVGGGIVALTGVAVAITGGGVPLAFILAGLTILIVSLPYAAIGSTLPVTGGTYAYSTRFIHPLAGYASMCVMILAQTSMGLYGIAAGQYLSSLFPSLDATMVAVGLITLLYVANLFGASVGAQLSIVMTALMLAGFGIFIAFGLPEVDWANYPPVMPHGFMQFFQAAALLTFAIGGATLVVELGGEMKNPGRSIPVSIIGSTAIAGILYAGVGLVAAGVLPIEQVANQPLSVVAGEFLTPAAFVFFILGGAMVAVISTVNSQLLTGAKSLLVAVDDGWFPPVIGRVNKRFGTPHFLLTLLFLVALAPPLFHIPIDVIGSAVSGLVQLMFIFVVVAALRLRYLRPDLNDAAPFRLNLGLQWVLSIIGVLVCTFQAFLLFSQGVPGNILLVLAAVTGILAAWAVVRYRHVRRVFEKRAQPALPLPQEANADVIIIGSGFGGSVAAARLVEAGLKVIVLERGPWRKTVPVEHAGIAGAAPLPRQNRPGLALRGLRAVSGIRQMTFNKRGLLELHLGRGVKAVTSSSVGGGSQIWGAAVARPVDPAFWDGLAEGVSGQTMAVHYERAKAELGAARPASLAELPNHTSHAFQETGWFEPMVPDAQYPAAIFLPGEHGGHENAQHRTPSDLAGNDGMFGSPNGAKATVDAIYLIPALGENLSVLDLHEADFAERKPDGHYLVRARNLKDGSITELHAPRVILAAGTMNSVKLLFASQEQGKLAPMPCLGKGFGTNGDCVAVWQPGDQERDATKGTPIHGRLKVIGQPEGVNLLLAAPERPPLPDWMPHFLANKANNVGDKFQVVAMGADRADGELSYRKGRLQLDYDHRNSPVFDKIFKTLDRLAELSGVPVKFDRKSAMTAHPLGGCRIGRTGSNGVVDGAGQVHGNPGLYVADASVFPAPTGAPPSLSIAAWSSHVAAGIIAAFGK